MDHKKSVGDQITLASPSSLEIRKQIMLADIFL